MSSNAKRLVKQTLQILVANTGLKGVLAANDSGRVAVAA